VTRGGLGVELNRPLELGPLVVTGLAMALPGLRYPVDLSKGVKQFRSRRGSLQRIVVAASAIELSAYVFERVGGALGEPLLGARLWPIEDPNGGGCSGLGVGIFSTSRSLAFDVLWCAVEGARAVLDNVRGVGLEAPAHAVALTIFDALLPTSKDARTPSPRRQGRVASLGDVPSALARAVLPDLGFRLPATTGLAAGPLLVRDEHFELAFDVEADVEEPDARVLLALESALQLKNADDLLAQGRSDEAREAYLEAYARAPGLEVAARALADIDTTVPGRQEAALSTLEEVGGAEAAGPLGAQALVAAGHVERARHALVDASATEAFGPLSAQLLCRAAQLAEETATRVAWLDRAVSRAPNVHSARWLRFEDRVRRGDSDGAVADGQHLEAAASGSAARHAVCLRVGRRLAEAGYVEPARRFLEKSLRYAPDDIAARAALGRLFASMGLAKRAVALLQVALGADEGAAWGPSDPEQGEVLLDLARALGDGLGDVPQAIARLRQVSARVPAAARARALEAEYCERIGDLTGASRAYGRLREASELGWAKGEAVARALRRAARFEESLGELNVAERHLHAALLLCPNDAELSAEYRRVAAACHAAAPRGSAR
jgi:tetratricopeptide (TPR) repeat protein